MESGRPTGPGQGLINNVGAMSQPHGYTQYRIMHPGSYLRIQRAFSEPTLLQAAKGVLCLHVGGTVTHQARIPNLIGRLIKGKEKRRLQSNKDFLQGVHRTFARCSSHP